MSVCMSVCLRSGEYEHLLHECACLFVENDSVCGYMKTSKYGLVHVHMSIRVCVCVCVWGCLDNIQTLCL